MIVGLKAQHTTPHKKHPKLYTEKERKRKLKMITKPGWPWMSSLTATFLDLAGGTHGVEKSGTCVDF